MNKIDIKKLRKYNRCSKSLIGKVVIFRNNIADDCECIVTNDSRDTPEKVIPSVEELLFINLGEIDKRYKEDVYIIDYIPMIKQAIDKLQLVTTVGMQFSGFHFLKSSLVGKAYVDGLEVYDNTYTYNTCPSKDTVIYCLEKIIKKMVSKEGYDCDPELLKQLEEYLKDKPDFYFL